MLVVYASRGGNVASLVNSLNVRALNIDEATLYRRLKRNGDFRKKEIDKMIGFFGFEKVKSFLFSENLHNANC